MEDGQSRLEHLRAGVCVGHRALQRQSFQHRVRCVVRVVTVGIFCGAVIWSVLMPTWSQGQARELPSDNILSTLSGDMILTHPAQKVIFPSAFLAAFPSATFPSATHGAPTMSVVQSEGTVIDPPLTTKADSTSSNVGRRASGVVLNYYRFGDGDDLSIRIDQFNDHLEAFQTGAYNVISLGNLLESISKGQPLPPRTVVVTVSNAFASSYDVAYQQFKRYGIPWTILIPTSVIGRPGYLTWEQLRKMSEDGVAIGTFGPTIDRLPDVSDDRALADSIRASRDLIAANVGQTPVIFAYPRGIASATTWRIVMELGFIAGLGQHSGVVDRTFNRLYIPRFFISESTGDMAHFQRITGMLGLEVKSITPEGPTLAAQDRHNTLVLLQDEQAPLVKSLSCYDSKQGRLAVESVDQSALVQSEQPSSQSEQPSSQSQQSEQPSTQRKWLVRLVSPMSEGRSRINCIAVDEDRQYWFGYQYFVQ